MWIQQVLVLGVLISAVSAKDNSPFAWEYFKTDDESLKQPQLGSYSIKEMSYQHLNSAGYCAFKRWADPSQNPTEIQTKFTYKWKSENEVYLGFEEKKVRLQIAESQLIISGINSLTHLHFSLHQLYNPEKNYFRYVGNLGQYRLGWVIHYSIHINLPTMLRPGIYRLASVVETKDVVFTYIEIKRTANHFEMSFIKPIINKNDAASEEFNLDNLANIVPDTVNGMNKHGINSPDDLHAETKRHETPKAETDDNMETTCKSVLTDNAKIYCIGYEFLKLLWEFYFIKNYHKFEENTNVYEESLVNVSNLINSAQRQDVLKSNNSSVKQANEQMDMSQLNQSPTPGTYPIETLLDHSLLSKTEKWAKSEKIFIYGCPGLTVGGKEFNYGHEKHSYRAVRYEYGATLLQRVFTWWT